jgi:urease accessory protein
MLRAKTIIRRAAVRPERVADTVTLAHAARRLSGETPLQGAALAFTAALPKAAELEDGDALRLEDGRLVLVRAAEEALLAVSAENPARLLRLAWQLGSNHVPSEMSGDGLLVPDAPATAELVRGLGCAAAPVTRPFRPERAVHAHDHAHCGHDHAHDDHGHDHHAHHDHAHGAHAHAEHAHDHAHHDHHDHAGHDHAHRGPRHG